MKRSRRNLVWPLLALAALILATAGCESEPTAPEINQTAEAPTLPDPELLEFDLSFFESAQQLQMVQSQSASGDGPSYQNFLNAYGRACVINMMTHLLLAQPIAVFALALHTPPSPQEDGSYIWVYTFVNGAEEAQIRLRGLPIGDSLEWELRVTNLYADPPLDNEVWFTGETTHEGVFGRWTFFDPTREGDPMVAELAWGTGVDGNYLTLTCLDGEDEGDKLTFRDDYPYRSVEVFDASAASDYFIRWNEVDGSGSLLVPDYNDGQEACWNEDFLDVDCE